MAEKSFRNIKTVELYPWQKDVIGFIDKHETERDSEKYAGLSDYVVNRELQISVVLPRGAGHTFLSNYIAAKYPSILIYNKLEHYSGLIGNFEINSGTEVISSFEIYYAMHKPSNHQPSQEISEITKKIQSKKIIIVDNSLSVPTDVKDYLLGATRGAIVFLGHYERNS